MRGETQKAEGFLEMLSWQGIKGYGQVQEKLASPKKQGMFDPWSFHLAGIISPVLTKSLYRLDMRLIASQANCGYCRECVAFCFTHKRRHDCLRERGLQGNRSEPWVQESL